MQNYELNKHFTIFNNQIHQQVSQSHLQPKKVTRTTSFLEPLLFNLIDHFFIVFEPINLTKCTKQISLLAHRPPHKQGVVDQTNLGKCLTVVGVSSHANRGIKNIMTIRGGSFSQSLPHWFRFVEETALVNEPASTDPPKSGFPLERHGIWSLGLRGRLLSTVSKPPSMSGRRQRQPSVPDNIESENPCTLVFLQDSRLEQFLASFIEFHQKKFETGVETNLTIFH